MRSRRGRIDFGVSTGFTAWRTMGVGPVRLADMRRRCRSATTPVSAKTAPGSRAKISIEARVSEPAMAVENIDTLVVGGGQAGLAMAEHLSQAGVPHIVLERHRIAERWRSERWDSLVANGPAWHDRFPGLEFPDLDPDAFASKEQVADYFAAYAEKIAAPIRCGVEVTSVQRNQGRAGFRAQ